MYLLKVDLSFFRRGFCRGRFIQIPTYCTDTLWRILTLFLNARHFTYGRQYFKFREINVEPCVPNERTNQT